MEDFLLMVVGFILGIEVLSFVFGLAFYVVQKLWVLIFIASLLSYNFGAHARTWMFLGIVSFVLDMLNR